MGEDIFVALKQEVKEWFRNRINHSIKIETKGKLHEVSVAFVPLSANAGQQFCGFRLCLLDPRRLIEKGVYDAKEPRWIKLPE